MKDRIIINKYRLTKNIAILCLAIYALCILYLTNFSRTPTVRRYELDLFWSYIKWFNGNKSLGLQIIANILIYIPVGFIAYGITQNSNKALIYAITIGFILSIISELGQLVFKLGLFEFDDIFDNTLGTCIGALIIKGINAVMLLLGKSTCGNEFEDSRCAVNRVYYCFHSIASIATAIVGIVACFYHK